jgi:hypothetical protein
MNSAINRLAADGHVAEFRGVAERRRATPSSSGNADAPTIELRVAHADEVQVVRRLAALDDAPELEGQVVLALIGGEAVAGLSLRDRRVVANPFVPTGEAVALLRLRAEHLSPARPRHRLGRILRPRLA